jgi:hypothetical protein
MLTWLGPALALPGVETEPDVWPALNWMYQRCMYLFEWEQIPTLREWVRSLPQALEHAESYQIDGLHATWVSGDMQLAAEIHERAAQAFVDQGDEYSAVRQRSISLVFACAGGVDDRYWDAVEALAAQARRLESPLIRAQGIGFVVAGQPGLVLADPARALRLLDEAAPFAARCRNPIGTKGNRLARVLALVLLGDLAALDVAVEGLEVSRNRLQVYFQVGILAVVLSVTRHHREAAELLGALSLAKATDNTFRRSATVVRAWEATRTALGEADYSAAFARGAARDYDELIEWLRGVLDRLVTGTATAAQR